MFSVLKKVQGKLFPSVPVQYVICNVMSDVRVALNAFPNAGVQHV
jgi:hypothetical protein